MWTRMRQSCFNRTAEIYQRLIVDRTGETPWTLEMIKKYDSVAKANNAIVKRCVISFHRGH